MAAHDQLTLKRKRTEILHSFGAIDFDPDFEYRNFRRLDNLN